MTGRRLNLAGLAVAWFFGLLTAMCPAAVLAGYEIPAAGTSEGGGTASAGSYRLTYTIGQSSPVGLGSAAALQLASGLAPLVADVVPPAIAHTVLEPVPPRAPVDISAQIIDMRSGIDTVRVLFREGGLLTFREKPMQLVGQNTYSAALPPSAVTERGVVYYIEARDRVGNLACHPAGAPDSVINLSVRFTGFSSGSLPAGAYRMVSVPGVPDSGDPDSVLADDFGPYDRKSWRLGRWSASAAECGEQCYDEYPEIEDFAPGRAFWLISSMARSFDVAGFSADITHAYKVPLARGWNQVSTPFGFATDWLSARIGFGGNEYSIGDLHVVGPDTLFVEDNLIGYDGAYQTFRSEMRPWEGYWIHNSGSEDVELIVAPQPSVAAASLEPNAGPPAAGDFAIQLKVGSSGRPERVCTAGLSTQASDAWDPLDFREPPAIGDYLRAVFPRKDWGRHSGNYTTDTRQAGSEGAVWDFAVESSGSAQASLGLATAGQIPEGWRVFLYDLESGLRLDAASLPHRFAVEGSRAFLLVAGTDRFIADEEASGGIILKAGIVSTKPNPFGGQVSITFFVPSRQPARIEAFSVEGRLVRALHDGVTDSGIHTVVWDGESRAGHSAAPGIYFLRLEAGDEVSTTKVMKIR